MCGFGKRRAVYEPREREEKEGREKASLVQVAGERKKTCIDSQKSWKATRLLPPFPQVGSCSLPVLAVCCFLKKLSIDCPFC